ncbi:mechanosensitive ion channel family protein [Rathayibacter soli]|uniref:mechanosensitive ion channel family protein n=1 Tax=Rathayibacter soli TaxID=3144168 RepID=UPI0039083C1D
MTALLAAARTVSTVPTPTPAAQTPILSTQSPSAWLDSFYNTLLGRSVAIIVIIVLAFVAAWILRLVIRHTVRRIVNGVKKNQHVEDTQALLASPLAAVRVVQRTRTLGTVLSNIVNVVIAIIAIILVVNTINKDIIGSFALITAAVGAGLGFGAQNIVKDVLNGLFMVMEDQLGVGDVVDLGPATGVVEAVGIRITQIRDVNGTLWFVRNGEILRVGNMSQGWARVIIDLAVPYNTDVDAVQDRMLQVAQELASTPKWRSRILEKPELWGMESVSPDAIVLRIVIKTRTTAKDDVSRELRARLKAAVDELGIQLPSLNTVVLAGFDGAASVTGARPPRTRPVTVQKEPAPKKPRGRKPRPTEPGAITLGTEEPHQ